MQATATLTQWTTLADSEWRERQRAHQRRVDAWIGPHRARQAAGRKHPVYDFLFSYYSFRPAWLRQWHPGPDVLLTGGDADEFQRWPEYARRDAGVSLNLDRMSHRLREFVPWLRDYLEAVRVRPAFFGCAGAHEWAMVYRQAGARRHEALPLRLAPAEVDRVVESLPLCCTHFDAFRFFAADARPLNRVQLTRDAAPANDQRGCLHANMDLYKWAFKLAPFAPSELIADCFALAVAIREVDMRASPYDLRQLGFEPIAIECASGRADYERHQREFARRADPLRERLLGLCQRLTTP